MYISNSNEVMIKRNWKPLQNCNFWFGSRLKELIYIDRSELRINTLYMYQCQMFCQTEMKHNLMLPELINAWIACLDKL